MTGLLFVLCIPGARASIDETTITLADDTEIAVNVYPSSGQYLAIWIAPEYGFRTAHRQLAQKLSEQGTEIWQSNILESLFLPQGTQSQKKLDGRYIAELVQYAHKKTSKKIILIGDSYAAPSVLTGAHKLQSSPQSVDYLVGAVLFSPYTYAYIPPLGKAPEYMPIVSSTNIPIMIYQSENSATSGQINLLLQKLQQHGNPVYIKKVPGIMSLFYQKTPTPKMQQGAEIVLGSFNKMISILDQHQLPEHPVDLEQTKVKTSGIDIYLKKFSANNKPLNIRLKDIHGNLYEKSDFKGKVTVINFWATWCPPCVEEIPSLNRLKLKLKDYPFELVSINYAEEKQVIRDFMKKIHVKFTVLLDQDGEFAKRWNVISYPSTFIINKEGEIAYGVNAAIEWDNEELVSKIKSMF